MICVLLVVEGNRLLCTRERDRARCMAEIAEQRQERLMKWREIGLGTLPRLAMCINILLCIVHIYIANMQYIHNYHARYKYTIQVAHAHPTTHHIMPTHVRFFCCCCCCCIYMCYEVMKLQSVCAKKRSAILSNHHPSPR